MRAVTFLLLASLVACAESPTKSTSRNPTDPDNNNSSYDNDDDSYNDYSNNGNSSNNNGLNGQTVNLSWNKLDGFVYSFDVKAPDGTWVGPCLDVSIIGSSTSTTFDGTCRSASGRTVTNPAGYRLFYTNDIPNRHWADYVEAPAGSTNVTFNIPTTPPPAVTVSWNRKNLLTDYSFDVILKNGERVRPCVDWATIAKGTQITFDGNCSAAPNPHRVDLGQVSEVIVCWADNGDWDHAGCAGLPYTGLGRERKIPN